MIRSVQVCGDHHTNKDEMRSKVDSNRDIRKFKPMCYSIIEYTTEKCNIFHFDKFFFSSSRIYFDAIPEDAELSHAYFNYT